MAVRLEEKKSELLERAVARVRERLDPSQRPLTERFLQNYYRTVPPDDLCDRDPLDLYGAALGHFRFAECREPGTALVRVYNPQVEQNGWQSTHTVVEIVNDDMPFLVDSVSMALNRLGLMIHLTIHPVMWVRRGARGMLDDLPDSGPDNGNGILRESLMQIEVDRQSDPERLDEIRQVIEGVLIDCRAAVHDWRTMLGKVEVALEDLRKGQGSLKPDELAETEAFLNWIADNHFTFLGYACYDLISTDSGAQLRRQKDSSLGILSLQEPSQAFSHSFAELPEEVKKRAYEPVALVVTKANTRSTVHRPVYLDYLGVKRFDEEGRVLGEHRFLGLFTSAAYNQNPRSIPLLRQKIARIEKRAGLAGSGHAAKALANILETYPRDELFQSDDQRLFDVSHAILHLQDRQKVRLFLRKDAFARFVSCLIYVPRDRYNTHLRERFQKILMKALNGTEYEYQTQISDSVLARLQFTIRTGEGGVGEVDVLELEQRLVEATRSWTDLLREALIDAHGEEAGNSLYREYGGAFPVGYQDDVAARSAVPDIDRLHLLQQGRCDLAMSFYRSLEHGDGMVRFKLAREGAAIPLSDVLPVLENMGLRVVQETPYEILTRSNTTFWLHDFVLSPKGTVTVDPEQLRAHFEEAFAAIWHGEAESDGFNQLVLLAGLSWRQVAVLRAYCKHLLQINIPFSQVYMEDTLARNPELARQLAELFEERFDPDREDDGRVDRIAAMEATFRAGLDSVANLDEDRILRRYLRSILATIRTNYFQPDEEGAHKPYISFKIDPALVPEIPLPRPAFEIFVYSPRMEGVHLRGGKVARGGIRWSDRREDFRTEILGLMKAQMVKNGVIVPVGAKGGFVVKRPPAGGDRAALQAEVIACYQTLMRGMLDITDNRVGDEIHSPKRVVRFDSDDPYLVVAADKGTATFSDIANEISLTYGHWLGDAFASGGSAGYDHKGMGITARGAWESVKRHFLEMGKDCQREPFTAIGIGDMSGDVFGNGMLLSEQTKLVAAFNHMHIFIDPDPDPATSFAERKRLFELGRSTWDDYDRSTMSQGGGIWPRTLKSIRLPEEARRALDIKTEDLTPHELCKAILLAPVELFWNGGIGTYVKSHVERHAEAFDRANDPIRVDGRELRSKVVGEGGNLGFTQKGRVEFAQNGGRINTDFIDNSAGVDCSDHEVNIKILLGKQLDQGDMTAKQRDELLASMTDEVGHLVLRNNILQVQAISLAERRHYDLLDSQTGFMRRLEGSGRLNRELEVLPDDETLTQRRQGGRGLYRPEISVVIAYSKMWLYDELLATEVPDEPYLVTDLVKYFPRPLRKRFREGIERHGLRREISATLLANSIVNRGLGEYVSETNEQTGRTIASIARAYIVARDAFAMVPLLGELELLVGRIGADAQMGLFGEARDALAHGSHWFLRHLGSPIDIGAGVARFGPGIATLLAKLEDVLDPEAASRYTRRLEAFAEQGIDESCARRLAALKYLFPFCEVVSAAEETNVDVTCAGRTFFALDGELRLFKLQELIERTRHRNNWERYALDALYDDLFRERRRLTVEALEHGSIREVATSGDGDALPEAIRTWLSQEVEGHRRWQRLLDELDSAPSVDLAMLAVAIRSLTSLDPQDQVAA